MPRIDVELLTDQGNNAVIQLPDRQFPGVLVQGDTLHAALGLVSEALEALEGGDSPEAQNVLRDLAAQLDQIRQRYERALKERGIPLPY